MGEFGGKGAQVGEQSGVGDDAGHLVLAAEPAAAAHPFGEPAGWQHPELWREQTVATGSMRLVI